MHKRHNFVEKIGTITVSQTTRKLHIFDTSKDHGLDTNLERFDRKILDGLDFRKVLISEIVFDDVIHSLFASANPVAGIRATSKNYDEGAKLYNLLALQSPIICYRFRKNYRALTGNFTLATLQRAQATLQINADAQIPVFILEKKPDDSVKKAIALFSLTNDLLSKCFISDAKKIGFYLRAWFSKDEGKKSLFQSAEWSALFPHIDTAEKLASHLSISKTELFRGG